MVEFPKSNVVATGQSYDSRNEKKGQFYGHIKESRAISSPKDSTVFGVLDIEAVKPTKERKPFQFYLHYNDNKKPDRKDGSSKASRSVGFLKNSATKLAIACGKTPKSPKEGEEMAWAEKIFKAIEDEDLYFWFEQSKGSQGLEIEFITEDDLDEAPTSKDDDDDDDDDNDLFE